jgi:hypothetical protein
LGARRTTAVVDSEKSHLNTFIFIIIDKESEDSNAWSRLPSTIGHRISGWFDLDRMLSYANNPVSSRLISRLAYGDRFNASIGHMSPVHYIWYVRRSWIDRFLFHRIGSICHFQRLPDDITDWRYQPQGWENVMTIATRLFDQLWYGQGNIWYLGEPFTGDHEIKPIL